MHVLSDKHRSQRFRAISSLAFLTKSGLGRYHNTRCSFGYNRTEAHKPSTPATTKPPQMYTRLCACLPSAVAQGCSRWTKRWATYQGANPSFKYLICTTKEPTRDAKSFSQRENDPSSVRMMNRVLANFPSLWYYLRWFHRSWRLYVSLCKQTKTKFLA
jgi:hypothetical protein